ncbi:vacuolar protein sorting protein 35 [Emiliania huxleyi CCMP1516]|uniref:Vacuolar protein sorting-associated protein 35 n=2 Tax=Emiliania huxleyi TaxID=2903 RepID=A0A0D3KFQ4_EMIH1|nr:vacuolar protein sorting protein 35 [Emiliania huxleyi CCMP1516]EOD34589.1 vacuolar protein sorting protein 35 [Emiliania huxleyi CCMP1516]|eukprot:XP_005787018.1 vacuolar protein sorting protein 35 [Emiliania huxleyi CCMP1516]
MIGELRTSALGPKAYYEVYIDVTTELRHLEEFFEAEHERGRPMVELYELVQHAGNVLPRLYLLLAVGRVFLQSKEAAAKVVLEDLVEHCKGVQQPLRGLFLRNYLLQCTRERLPDTGSDYEGEGGTVSDAIKIVLANFGEMAKLWVRMQHQGPAANKEQREKERAVSRVVLQLWTASLHGCGCEQERAELKVVVGGNLHRLASLEGVTLQVYTAEVVQPLLELIVSCKDGLAQEYLLECVCQVFPVAYHTATLPTLLRFLSWLSAAADESAILSHLISRLCALEPADGETEARDVFTPVADHVERRCASLRLLPSLALALALARLALEAYEAHTEYLERALSLASTRLESLGVVTEKRAVAVVQDLLSLPLKRKGGDVLYVLELTEWPRLAALEAEYVFMLVSRLEPDEQRRVVSRLLREVAGRGCVISDSLRADRLLHRLGLDAELADEMAPVAAMMHALAHEDTDAEARVLNAAYKHAAAAAPGRLPHLARRVRLAEEGGATLEVSCGKLLAFVGQIVQAVTAAAPNLALRLYVQCAQVADSCGDDDGAYEYLTQAFTLFEEEARAVAKASFAFWPLAGLSPHRNAQRALECLQRALKIADGCKRSGMHAPLFVEILDAYLWHYEQGNDLVTLAYISSLMQLIDQHVAEWRSDWQAASDAPGAPAHVVRYVATRRHISAKVRGGSQKYEGLQL